MTAFYSLWDVEVGTSLGTFESEAEALAIVDAILHANGDDYARVLDLGRYDNSDSASPVAAGDALLTRVREWRAQHLVGVESDN